MKMSGRWAITIGVAAALVIGGGTVVSAGAASRTEPATQAYRQGQGPDYYLSLGDSLSVGFQPGPDGVGHPTDQGYDHDLVQALNRTDRFGDRNLNLVELGCPGDSTTTVINGGGLCTYPNATSQLDAATKFLAAHRGHVPLVTLDIGANDVEDCASATGIDPACVQQGLATVQKNLPTIVGALKKADPGIATRFVGFNEYDPFLASFLQGTTGQELAKQSVEVTGALNQIIAGVYRPAGFRVADVATAFKTTEFSPLVPLPGAGQVPVNVATVCQLTFMCAPAPVGPNIHPNATGYRVLARAAEAKL